MIKAVETLVGLLSRKENEVRYIGGIPSEIFKKRVPFRDRGVFGKSGAEYWISLEEGEVIIQPIGDNVCSFEAEVSEEGMMQFDIRTKYIDGTRHPDLYAGKLLKSACEFFAKHGTPVEMIKGRWSVPVPEFKNRDLSDNYEAFMANLKGELSPSFEQLKEAAMSTWTGRWADKMGYSNIYPGEIEINKGTNGKIINIEVVFSR